MTHVIRIRGVFLGSVIATLFFSVFQISEAALLYIDPKDATINRGDTTILAVRIDTDEDECINTVDATIKYDDAVFVDDISRGDSILSIWVEDPVVNKASGTISFAGGIPGGYCGRIPGDPRLTNVVAELIFRSPGFNIGADDTKTASVRFTESSQVLLHDGFGTVAPLRTQGATLTLLDATGSTTEDGWNDRIVSDDSSPADFSIILTQDPIAFNGKYYIVFNTQDKQSGIDHFEVMEEPFEDFDLFKWGAADAPWITATSPYVLKDQSLNSTIRVRAIDNAGNETVAVHVPEATLRKISQQRIISFSILFVTVGLVLTLAGFALWRRRKEVIEDYNDGEYDE